MDLEYFNKKLEKEVREKKVYQEMLVLKREKILPKIEMSSFSGYEKTGKSGDDTLLYNLYYNEKENTYALVSKSQEEKTYAYILEYTDEELIESVVAKCKQLKSFKKVEETNVYNGVGVLLMILALIFAFAGGEGGIVILVPGLFLAALYFGIGRIVKDLEKIKSQI